MANHHLGDTDDPSMNAIGQVWSLDRADAETLQHPNCTRSFQPYSGELSVSQLGAR